MYNYYSDLDDTYKSQAQQRNSFNHISATANISDKESGITQYEYDALIQLSNVIDYINSVIKYAYDNHENLILDIGDIL